MKPFKAKTEYIILGAVIAASLLYLLLRNPNQINYQLPGLPAIDKAGIDRVEYAKAGQTVRLGKKDGAWRIEPQGFAADAAKLNSMVDAVANLRLTALVSESKNYSPYGLDLENAITVKAFAGGKLLREFVLGNAASTYNHTYVKLVDDTRVFHAKNSFRSDFDQKIDDLRDKSVLQVDKNQITAVEIATAGAKVLFSKQVKPVEVKAGEKQPQGQAATPAPEESWLMADGNPGNGGELNGIIDAASQLVCEQFIVGKIKDDFKEPLYTVLLKGAKDFQLAIFRKDEKETNYPAVSSESPYPFLLAAYKAENIMKKLETLKSAKPAGK